MGVTYPAEILLKMNDQASKATEQFGSKLGGLAKKALKLGVAGGVVLGGLAVAGGKSFIDLENSMNEVFTLLPNISEDAMDDMTGQVKDFSKEFGTLPNEVVPALYQAISAGVPQDNVFDFMAVANKAAIGGVASLETAVDGITSVVNAYGSDVLSAGEASDAMFTAVKLGKTNFDQLSSSLFNVIPTAAGLGVEFDDVAAALATLTAQGTPTSVATTQLRAAFDELGKTGSDVSDTFTEIAGKSFQEFIAEGGNTSEALNLLKKHADDTGVGMKDLFSSSEAGGAALALAGKGAESFASNIEAMGNKSGASEAAYNRMNKGIARSIDKIKSFGAVFLTDIGEKLAPTIRKLVNNIIRNLPKIQATFESVFDFIGTEIIPRLIDAFNKASRAVNWIIKNWPKIEPVMKVIGTIVGVVLVNHFVRLAIQSTITAVRNVAAWVVMQASTIAASAVMIAKIVFFVGRMAWMGIQALIHGAKVAAAWLLAMGPIAIIVAAVIALVALIILNWDKIREVTAALWDSIKRAAKAAWDGFMDILRRAWEGILRVGKALLKGGILGLINEFILKPFFDIDLFEMGKDVVLGLWDGIRSMGRFIKNKVLAFIKRVLPGPVVKALGIDSPSKVFAEIGKNVGLGLTEGVLGTSKLVSGAVKGLVPTNVSSPSVAGLGMAGGAIGGSTIIHIHGDIVLPSVRNSGEFVDGIRGQVKRSGIRGQKRG